MRQSVIWFWMSCKRYLHRISFVLILLLLPLGTSLIRGLERKEGSEIRIAVCVGQAQSLGGEHAAVRDSDREPALEQQLLDTLLSRSGQEGMFRFYSCTDEEQVKDEVASRRAECGFVFPSGLRRLLDDKAYKRCIQVYSAPSTVAAQLSSEVVFAALIRHYDRELFARYVTDGEVFGVLAGGETQEELREEAYRLYDAWMGDGGTFHFQYEQVQETASDRTVPAGPVLFPVRGIVAVYVFVIGLYGAAASLMDERKGLFLALPSGSRVPCQVAGIMGPAVLAAVSGLAALIGGGDFRQIWYELAVMGGYVLAVALFSWLLRQICRREEVLGSLIPFFLIGSLVFCPVFIDVGRYLPAVSAAGTCFLPWYYLRMF